MSRATSSYLYSITVHPPDNQLTHKELYTYTVEAYIYRNSDAEYSLCLCNYTSQSNVVVNFSANLFAGLQSKYFYIRAAVVSSTDGVSDFQPYYVNNSTCGSEINLGEPAFVCLYCKKCVHDSAHACFPMCCGVMILIISSHGPYFLD